MEFSVRITLNNDGMARTRDVSRALRRLADHIYETYPLGAAADTGYILDDEGTEVGRWELYQGTVHPL